MIFEINPGHPHAHAHTHARMCPQTCTHHQNTDTKNSKRKQLDSLDDSLILSSGFFTLEDIYNYCFLNAHDVTDKEHQLLPTELLTTVCVKKSKLLFIYTDSIVNEGKTVTN